MRWGVLVLFLLVLAALAISIYVAWTQYRARKRGLPAPTWHSYVPFANSRGGRGRVDRYDGSGSGIGQWFRDKWAGLRGRRQTRGSYGEPLEGPWDVRMGDNLHSVPYSAHQDEEDDIGFNTAPTYYGARYDTDLPAYPDRQSATRSQSTAAPAQDIFGERPQSSQRVERKEQHVNPFVSEEDDDYEAQSAPASTKPANASGEPPPLDLQNQAHRLGPHDPL